MSILKSSRTLQVIVGIVGVLLTLLLIMPGPLVELLWMQELGYAGVFWTILATKVGMFALMFAAALAFFGVNLRYLIKQIPPLWASNWASEGEEPQMGGQPLTRGRLKRIAWGAAVLIALLFAAGFAGQWNTLLRYIGAESYGMSDPVFGIDAGFYMLELPFVQALQSAVVGLAFLGLLVLAAAYVLIGEIGIQNGQLQVRPGVVRHLGANVVLLMLGWAWGFYLDRFDLLQSASGAVYGAGYTDVNVTLPMLWVMIAATLGLAGIVTWNLFQYRLRMLLYGIALYVVVLIGGLVIAPSVVDQLQVEPNELEYERPYLENNIQFTREAYNLNKVQETSYPAEEDLSMAQIQEHDQTINNVRLWDPRLLIDNYQQLQQIRLYYQFYDVDIDRYMVDGEYRQVMLSARELTQQLPQQADTWYNRHLQYTHGYGTVGNLVAQEGAEGTPNLLVKNLPPEAAPGMEVDEPAIYYGERAPTHAIVNTNAQELDYPRGDENVYTNYAGTGGVLLNSFWKEALLSWYLSDFNIILSDNIHDQSRIQLWNRLQERIRRIAPFLQLDADPYVVLSDDRQYWIQDAYTTSGSFPYSEPSRQGLNYIRNSVKIVMDAYNGDVNFYVMDPDDPVLQTYQNLFPELFQPISAMSDDLRSHLRYPQDLFDIQVNKFNRYHMTTPQVFYNNEDLWTRPFEQYDGRKRRMQPYYIMSKLPDEDLLQFMLMTPVTPDNRENMIAWIAAKSDQPNYGELVVYKLPKDRLIYGPNQIESRIDQDTDISRQLTLWDQRGSSVVRGNLIVVPIEDSFLYVEPIYLIAQDVSIPQLQRVIVAHGDRVAMQRTLDASLKELFGARIAERMEMGDESVPVPPAPDLEALDEARQLIQQAREALQAGNFGSFGDRFDELEELLNRQQQPTPASPADTSEVGPPVGGVEE